MTTVPLRARRGPSSKDVPHPFLKWVGGKGRLTEELLAAAPAHFRDYFEPFVGGGALFFALFRAGRLKGHGCTLADINKELIGAYKAIQRDVDAVIACLREHRHTQTEFYRVRALDPDDLTLPQRCARMIYLNHTGFNGLYRVNKSGAFNVPFGRYKNPRICDEPNLRAVARALQDIELHVGSFENVMARAGRRDFIYCDPPYVPVSRTANFVAYARTGFSQHQQQLLAKACIAAHERGAFVMASNADVPVVHDIYSSFPVRRLVLANRSVNSRADRRGPVRELIITRYKPPAVR